MPKTVYEDYKYHMQDTGTLYIGAKYTLDEIVEEEELMFKFRMIVERYVVPEADREDTLETHLYYLEPNSFLVKIYKQLKAKVKVAVLVEKKNLFGARKKQYVSRIIKLEELVAIPPAEKEKQGMIIQELSLSKLALMSF